MGKEAVLITGATGFIGIYLAASLVNDGLNVYALTRRRNYDAGLDKRIRLVVGDIAEDIALPDEVTTIYHCAGVISQEDQMEKVNVYGTKRIVETALKRNCRLIHLSSAGVVGQIKKKHVDEDVECTPQSTYETTKLRAEEVVKEGVSQGLKAQILRPTIVFGIGRNPAADSFLQLIKSIKSGRYRHIGSGRGIYNLIHANEVVRALRTLDADDIPNGGTYFINNPISFSRFSEVVRDALHKPGDTPGIPRPVAFCVAALFSAVTLVTGRKMPLTFARLRALMDKRIFSQKHLLETTSYKPLLTVEDYVRQVCAEYEALGLLD